MSKRIRFISSLFIFFLAVSSDSLGTSFLPDISMAANAVQIEAHTDVKANPMTGAFDSQNRFLFFDQHVGSLNPSAIYGSNQLIRMTGSGSSASFETLVTQAQLAAVDSEWNSPDHWPVCRGIEELSDHSIMLCSYQPYFSSKGYKTQILRIVPGNPPQISVITSFYRDSYYPLVTVDKSQNPYVIYIAFNEVILSINADVTEGTPAFWYNTAYSFPNESPLDLSLDNNGDILYSTIKGWIHRINKVTKKGTSLFPSPISAYLPGAINGFSHELIPPSGDFIGGYWIDPNHPAYNGCVHFLYKISKVSEGNYTIASYVSEQQVQADPDIAPYYVGGVCLLFNVRGLIINPTGDYAYLCNGTNLGPQYYSQETATRSIIRIGTEPMTVASPDLWSIY